MDEWVFANLNVSMHAVIILIVNNSFLSLKLGKLVNRSNFDSPRISLY